MKKSDVFNCAALLRRINLALQNDEVPHTTHKEVWEYLLTEIVTFQEVVKKHADDQIQTAS